MGEDDGRAVRRPVPAGDRERALGQALRFPLAFFILGDRNDPKVALPVVLPTTRASFRAFLSFSSWSLGGSAMVKAIRVPSGDQAIPPTPVLTSVSCSASPPSVRMIQTLLLPDRLDVKAIHRPQGDQAGLAADFSPKVNW